MRVAVGEETACTYEGLWNIKGRCCFTATGIKWEPDCVATSQLSFFIFYCLMCLTGSHLQEPIGFGFSTQSYSLWSTVRKCQQSAESAQHWKFWCGPMGRWPEPGLWWVHSPDKTKIKKTNQVLWLLELNTLNRVSCASHSEMWTNVSRRTKAGQTRQGLGGMIWPHEFLYSSLQLRAAVESALSARDSGFTLQGF